MISVGRTERVDWLSGNRLLFLAIGLLVGFVLTSAMWVYIIDKKDYLDIEGHR